MAWQENVARYIDVRTSVAVAVARGRVGHPDLGRADEAGQLRGNVYGQMTKDKLHQDAPAEGLDSSDCGALCEMSCSTFPVDE